MSPWNYKPIWMFWHPGSGPFGGLIAGCVCLVIGYIVYRVLL